MIAPPPAEMQNRIPELRLIACAHALPIDGFLFQLTDQAEPNIG